MSNYDHAPMTLKRLSQTFLLLLPAFLLSFSAQADDLRIGTLASLTGPYATYGRQALNGIQLAVEEVNARGGVAGRKVHLIVEDVGTLELKRAVIATRKLISVDKVELLLPLIVEDSEVVVPITNKVPIFTMAVGCGARKCGFSIGKYHVRAPSSHDAIVETLVQYASAHQVKHTCIVAAEATYFEGYGRYIEELSKAAGQKTTYVSVPLSNTDDNREIATKFTHSSCDAIYSWLPMGAVGSFFKRVREGGSKALILSIVESDDPQVLETAGPAANGVVFARFSLGSEKFQKRYLDRFKESPSRPAIPSYDGVKLLLELVAKVGTDPKLLREAFIQVKNHPAENGTLTYTNEGERLGEEVQLMQIVEGAPKKIDA
jgi:branched-chain amino acid transport system substrate-binding protein